MNLIQSVIFDTSEMPSKKRTRRNILLIILGIFLCLLIAAGWLGFRYLQTKSSACECETPVDGARFALWNPFRDRSPERLGEQTLRAMQSKNCAAWTQNKTGCLREGRFTIEGWKLTGRFHHPDSIELRYWVTRTQPGHGRFDDPVWVNVERKNNTWQVTKVDFYD